MINFADLAVIGILAVIVALAVRSIIRQRKSGSGCSGSCATCMQKCGAEETAAELEELIRKKRAERHGADTLNS